MQTVVISNEAFPPMRDRVSLTLSKGDKTKHCYFFTKNGYSKKTRKDLARQIESFSKEDIPEPSSLFPQPHLPNETISKVYQLNKLVLFDEPQLDNPYEDIWKDVYDNSLEARKLPFSLKDNYQKDMLMRGIIAADNKLIEEIRNAYQTAQVPANALFVDKLGKTRKPVTRNYVKDLLMFPKDHAYYNKIAIAGGAVTDYILNLQPRDYDVFLVDADRYVIKDYVRELIIKFKLLSFTTSDMALSLNLLDEKDNNIIKVQIILFDYQAPGTIITGFDIPACACMYYQDKVWLTERCYWSLNKRLNYVDPTMVSNNYCLRLAKYALNKGIAVLVPNFDPHIWYVENNDNNAWLIKNSLCVMGNKCNNLGYLLQLHFTSLVEKAIDEMPSDYFQYIDDPITKKDLFNCFERNRVLLKPVAFKRPYYKSLFDSSNLPQVSTWLSFMDTQIEDYEMYSSLLDLTKRLSR